MLEFHMIHDAPSLFPVGIIFVELPYFSLLFDVVGRDLTNLLQVLGAGLV